MNFKDLYDYCQTLPVYISRNVIKDKVLELSGGETVAIMRATMDLNVQRGFFLSAKNTDALLVRQHGTNVIAVGRSQNACWERFIVVKELMHFFDSSEECTDTPKGFEENIEHMLMFSSGLCAQALAEIKCFWRALAVLCPEVERLDLKLQREKRHINDYGIALKLRIPEQYVKYLIDDRFPDISQKYCF